MHVTGGCRTLLGLSGVCWFLATPQVVGGPVGHDAALLGAVWLAPLATALLGSPDAVPARRFSACRGRRHLASRDSGTSRDRLADGRDGRVPGCCRAPGRPPLMRSGRRDWRPLLRAFCSAPPGCSRQWPDEARRLSRWSPSAVAGCGIAVLDGPPGPGCHGQRSRRAGGRAGSDQGCAFAGTAARARDRGPAAALAVPASAGSAVCQRVGTARRGHASWPGRHRDGPVWSGSGGSRARPRWPSRIRSCARLSWQWAGSRFGG